MWRGWLVLVLGVLPFCTSAAASAATSAAGTTAHARPVSPAGPGGRAEPVSRADHIAAALRRDPVYVTDHSPRSLPPDAAARIKASVARLGVPAYVAVTPVVGLGSDDSRRPLVPLLRDRLQEDGIYIVVSPSGGHGEATQFGGGRHLPVKDAWTAADLELPSDASAPAVIERFVDIVLSGKAGERRDRPRPRPKSKVREALDADEAAGRRAAIVEWGVFGGGTALSGGGILALVMLNRRRPRQNRKKQNWKKHTRNKPAWQERAGKKRARKRQAGKRQAGKGRR